MSSLIFFFLLLLLPLSSANLKLHVLHSSSTLSSPITSAASSGSGQYLVLLFLGSPPQPLSLVLDTASDLLWIRCSLSLRHHRRPHFLTLLSSTFRPLHCQDPPCRLVPHDPLHPQCHPPASPCRYLYSYSDLSSSSGFLSLDTATFKNNSSSESETHRLVFGCSRNSSGPSFRPSSPARGVLGLGRGPTSFPSQLSPRFGNTFSYCLLDYTLSPPPTSYLLVGHPPLHLRHHQSTTPLLINPLSPSFYYVGLLGVEIDGTHLAIDPKIFALDPQTGAGGTIIDSGTTLTFLPEAAYRQVLAAMERRLRLPRVSVSREEGAPEFDLCVNVSGVAGKELPRLGLRMTGDAVMSPPPRNYFVEAREGVRCLAVQPSAPDGFGVIGNLFQQGFLFVFDRDRNRLGFSRSGCAA